MQPKRQDRLAALDLDAFRERVRTAMAGESEAKFAKRAGIGQSTLNGILNGRTAPSLDVSIAIAIAGKVRLEWLATGSDEQSPALIMPDRATLEDAIRLMEEVLETAGRTANLQTKAKAVTEIYSLLVEDKHGSTVPLPQQISRVLKLVG